MNFRLNRSNFFVGRLMVFWNVLKLTTALNHQTVRVNFTCYRAKEIGTETYDNDLAFLSSIVRYFYVI